MEKIIEKKIDPFVGSVRCNKRVLNLDGHSESLKLKTGFPMEDLRFEEEGNYVDPEIFIT